MPKHGKKFRSAVEKIEAGKTYQLPEAVKLVKEVAFAKFNESVDLDFLLGVDPRHADQQVRGTVSLPHGTGKSVRVAVFCKGEKASEAEKAGAEYVGAEDLVAKIQAGFTDFDACIATPDMMGQVGRLGKVLGPRGLMPNPKTGTVTPDVATAVKNAKAGQVRYRADKGGIIHGGIGQLSFEATALKENLEALVADLKRAKPATAKGVYLKKISLSTTMGPGLVIDQSSLAI